MKIDKSQLDSLHGVGFVPYSFSPHLDTSVHHILVSLNAGPEQLGLVFLRGHLDQVVSLSLQLLPDGDLVLQFLSSGFELVVDIAVSDGVVHSFKKHFSPSSFYFLHHQLFLLEVLLVARRLTPAFPSLELDNFMLSLGVHHSQFHAEEHLLFEPHIGD